jgi:penicillin amidase
VGATNDNPDKPRQAPFPWRLARRVLFWTGIGIIVILILAGGATYTLIHASLPQLDGSVGLTGLSAPVKIERDARGVPTIMAANGLDAARALGYVHAQDRFFQMDLLRRAAAGELAALAGGSPGIVKQDRDRRRFRMRAVARQVLRLLPPRQRALIGAYTLGVNEGLAHLGARPFEYLLLREKPERWRPADCILVIMAMDFDLQDAPDQREQAFARMHAALPAPLYRFITPPGTRWDAPLSGKKMSVPPVPDADVIDLRKRSASSTTAMNKGASTGWHLLKRYVPSFPQRRESSAGMARPEAATNQDPDTGFRWYDEENEVPARKRIPTPLLPRGSNNWALAGSRTASGAALLANDMHLHLGVPPIWYRARLVFKSSDAPGGRADTTGITLPGVPGIVAGSNGHIAWGFTNAFGDWVDLVKLDTDADRPGRYRTPDGWRRFVKHKAVIHVRGAPDVTETVRDTIWGPVIGKGPAGHRLVAHWAAAQPSATDLDIWNLQTARNVDEAIDIATHSGLPELNFVVADARGHIGWTIAGRIPKRFGDFDPRLPSSWADAKNGWAGWLDPGDYPRIVDPESGAIYTANNRVVGGAALARLGDGGYLLGARARQIHMDLKPLGKATPAEMLSIQLDDRARFLDRWHRLLLRLITPAAAAANPRRAAFRRAVAQWGARASVDSIGYRLVREFHDRLRARVLAMLLAPVRARFPDFRPPALPQFEGALWKLVQKQPPNLLDSMWPSWNALMLATVDSIIADHYDPQSGFEHFTWGRRNTVRVRHPLSRAVSLLSPWLDMPAIELPGDANMPRVQGVAFGASMRMVVAPGDEAGGIFELPGGESGHPMSAYYGDEFLAWAAGRPTPFLPGETKHTLVLKPADDKSPVGASAARG